MILYSRGSRGSSYICVCVCVCVVETLDQLYIVTLSFLNFIGSPVGWLVG